MFPAHAGMNLALSEELITLGNVPRVCGDEPKALAAVQRGEMCSWGNTNISSLGGGLKKTDKSQSFIQTKCSARF